VGKEEGKKGGDPPRSLIPRSCEEYLVGRKGGGGRKKKGKAREETYFSLYSFPASDRKYCKDKKKEKAKRGRNHSLLSHRRAEGEGTDISFRVSPFFAFSGRAFTGSRKGGERRKGEGGAFHSFYYPEGGGGLGRGLSRCGSVGGYL